MGIFSFLKIKKNSLDVFLSKKLSVEDKLDYALKELDKRAFQYKENLIDLVARRDSLKGSLEDFQKKVKSTKKEASALKAEGKESLAKSKVMVMLSYQQAADELDKTYNQNSTWKTNYKDEIVEGIKKEVKDANVVLRVMRKCKEIVPVTLLIGVGDKKIDNHSSNAFRFDLYNGKIDGNGSPLMYLSPFDRSGNNTYKPSLKYMAMRSAEDLLKECGGKPWRKVIYKNPQDIISKTLRLVKDCLPLMNLYCGGDVLHGTELKGVLDISIADAATLSNI